MIGGFPVPINARYVCAQPFEMVLESGEEYTVQPKTIMTVNRIEDDGNTVVFKWMAFDLKPRQFIELKISENSEHIGCLKNFAY